MPIVTSVDNGTLVSGTADAGSTVIIRSGGTILGGRGRRFRRIFSSPFHQRKRRVKALNAIAGIQRVTKAKHPVYRCHLQRSTPANS